MHSVIVHVAFISRFLRDVDARLGIDQERENKAAEWMIFVVVPIRNESNIRAGNYPVSRH